MHTPKSKGGSSELTQKPSPRTARQLKVQPPDSPDSISSSQSKTPKDKSPKVTDHHHRRSPKTPSSSEKSKPTRVSALESNLAQLQEELKATKAQLVSSDSDKKQALLQSEEAEKQLAAIMESQNQLMEINKEKQSQIETIQNQHLLDKSALASALHEANMLKSQLESATESEASIGLVEKLKSRVVELEQSEARAMEAVDRTGMQLEMAKTTEQILRAEGLKVKEAYELLVVELERSKSEIGDLNQKLKNGNSIDDTNELKDEIESLKLEMKKSEIERNRAIASSEELDSSNRKKTAHLAEENAEMESELRRLRVQSDQWRKAAEAAAAMVSGCGKFVERTGSLDINYNTIGGRLGSPFSEDLEDESPKKKNGGGSMFKKIGYLLKKRA